MQPASDFPNIKTGTEKMLFDYLSVLSQRIEMSGRHFN